MNGEWTAESETEVVKLFEKLKREHQSGSGDQIDNDLAFAADQITDAMQSFGVTVALHEMREAMRLPNTRGFEPT